jgi:hypothetical protein
LVELLGVGTQLVGVMIGTHAVPAAGYAPVEGGDVPDAFPGAQGRVVPVEAQEQGVRVVVEDGSVPAEEGSGEAGGDPAALEPGRACGLYEGTTGCRAGHASASGEAIVQFGGRLGDAEGGLDVDQAVDSAVGASAVPAGGLGVERGAQVPVLDGEGDQPAGSAGDVPGERPAEAGEPDFSCRVGRCQRSRNSPQAAVSCRRNSPPPRSRVPMGPPHLTITGNRLTLERADQAVRACVNAVVFRTSGQNLTRTGNYIEMASRIIEPILLALAVLAVRARVKR